MTWMKKNWNIFAWKQRVDCYINVCTLRAFAYFVMVCVVSIFRLLCHFRGSYIHFFLSLNHTMYLDCNVFHLLHKIKMKNSLKKPIYEHRYTNTKWHMERLRKIRTYSQTFHHFSCLSLSTQWLNQHREKCVCLFIYASNQSEEWSQWNIVQKTMVK